MKEHVELIDPGYDEWKGSRRGPCYCWHGAGHMAHACYVASDGQRYVIEYTREFPLGTDYAVGLDGQEAAHYPSLKAAAKSPHLAAFKALHAFVVDYRKNERC